MEFRQTNQDAYPDFHNAPVAAFGPITASILIVGLAPGLKGANRSGRPFTGDYAGDLLYPTLIKAGLANGTYGAEADDGLQLTTARITNAVRCVPPQNKVTGEEAKTCRPFLINEMAAMGNLKVLLALGKVAHDAVLSTLELRKSAHPFGHAAVHGLPGHQLTLVDSYHCSRYNTNTGRLTADMFENAVKKALEATRD